MNVLNQKWVPPLVNGDHLTVAEFMRRYEAMPDLRKAELIEGVVYMASPVSAHHARPHGKLMAWLGMYFSLTPGVDLLDNGSLVLKEGQSSPQPDAILRRLQGGHSQVSEKGYVEGPPELVAEIAPSSVSYDLHEKREAYQKNQIREYLVWEVEEKRIVWFALKNRVYREIKATGAVLKSRVFPGLWLDAAALISGDMPAVLQCLQEGLATAEHQRFVAKLAKK